MTKTVQGVIHGRTIELAEDLGVPAGQPVEVSVTVLTPPPQQPGDGLRRWAATVAEHWTDEDDRILEMLYQEREHDTRREITE